MLKWYWIVGTICAISVLPVGAFADDEDDGDGGLQQPAELVVDCRLGDSINEALALAPGFVRLNVIIKGTCVEQVFIAVDDVTVRGDPAGGGRVEGQFTVDASRRVRIENLTISGGDTGIRVRNGAYVRTTNITIENMARRGVFALNGGIAEIFDTTILGPADDGILASAGAVLEIRNSTIEGTRNGISVSNGSALNIENSVIRNTDNDGISVTHGAMARVIGSEISAATDTAVSVTSHGHARLRSNSIASSDPDGGVLFVDGGHVRLEGGNLLIGANSFNSLTVRDGAVLEQSLFGDAGRDVITGALAVQNLSVASLSNALFTGGINVSRHAELELRANEPGSVVVNGRIDIVEDSLLLIRFGGGTVNGDVICGDEESSLSIATEFAAISGETICTGFD